jgi:hypothetical protein
MDEFMENSLLLDPYLSDMCKSILPLLNFTAAPPRHLQFFFLLYQLVRVRGYKSIGTFSSISSIFSSSYLGKYLPCDLYTFRSLLPYFIHESAAASGPDGWLKQYGCLVLFVNLVQIPIPIASIFSDFSIFEQFIGALYALVLSNAKGQSLSAIILARLATRTDAEIIFNGKLPLKSWVNCLQVTQLHEFIGLLYLKYYISKFSNSRLILNELDSLIDSCTPLYLSSSQARKLSLKILMLQPSQLDLYGNFQDAFNRLLDKDTENRWLAAKYLTKLYMFAIKKEDELSLQLCISSSLECMHAFFQNVDSHFVLSETDFNQVHALSIFLSEIIRLKLIDCHLFITHILPLFQKLLFFDTIIGLIPFGASLRDTACYMAWCVARNPEFFIQSNEMIEPEYLNAFQKLGSLLLISSLTDKLVGVRRAAAAAFQELIGRKRSPFYFQRDLDLLKDVNFFTVSSLSGTYRQIIPKILQYQIFPLTNMLIDYLFKNAALSWDLSIQKEAKITCKFIIDHVPYKFDDIFDNICSALSNSTILASCKIYGYFSLLSLLLPRFSVLKLSSKEFLWAKLTDLVLCPLLSTLSSSKTSSNDNLVYSMIEFVPAILAISEPPNAILDKLFQVYLLFMKSSFNSEFLSLSDIIDEESKMDIQLVFSQKVIVSLLDSTIRTSSKHEFLSLIYSTLLSCDKSEEKRGLILCLYPLPILYTPTQLIATLIELFKQHSKPSHYIVRDAILLKLSELFVSQLEGHQCIIEICFRALEDYSSTRKGDVGAFVRKRAMAVLQKLVFHAHTQWTALNAEKYISKLVRLSLERIDSLRQLASYQLSMMSDLPSFSYLIPKLHDPKTLVFHSDAIYGEFVRGLVYARGNLSDTYLDSTVHYFDTLYSQDSMKLSLCLQEFASFWLAHQNSPTFAHLLHCLFKSIIFLVEFEVAKKLALPSSSKSELTCYATFEWVLTSCKRWEARERHVTLVADMMVLFVFLNRNHLRIFIDWFEQQLFPCPRYRTYIVEQIESLLLAFNRPSSALEELLLEDVSLERATDILSILLD